LQYTIAPTEERHLSPIYEVIGAVARERRFLTFTQLPPRDESLAFYRSILSRNLPYFVALADQKVVGWVDVTSLIGQTRAHIGALGIGLLAEARGKGLGMQLMRAAIEKAWARGFTRIELTVRDDNLNAQALYKRLGFEFEGRFRRGSVVDGQAHDVLAMALLR